MAVNDLIGQLQLLLKTSAPPLIELTDSTVDLPQWNAGQQFKANVISNLANGRFQVQVDGQTLNMNLPQATQPGDTVELTFVTNQPRPTFVLSKDLVTTTAKPQVTLSDTARFLGTLIEKASSSETLTTTAAAKAAPLLSGPPTDTLALANALRTGLSQSGLFYESHQAQWIAGQRPLVDLLKEPQGLLSPALKQPADMNEAVQTTIGQKLPTPGNASPPLANAQPASAPPSGRQPFTQEQVKVDDAMHQLNKQMLGTSVNAVADNLKPQSPINQQTAPLVSQQLEALDSRQLIWQGQVWPGQNMEWRIEEQLPSHEEHPDQMQWHTYLDLTLPNLGGIKANLMLNAEGLQLLLKVSDPATVDVITQAQPLLNQIFQSVGLNLLNMSVQRNEET